MGREGYPTCPAEENGKQKNREKSWDANPFISQEERWAVGPDRKEGRRGNDYTREGGGDFNVTCTRREGGEKREDGGAFLCTGVP